ncbi:uncharacterized protein BDR25DRAFT_357224 [Lindgomyces ingoldianus]|uniref:Uncharacterized protein n=1 Tax=Lindgomyces ingoldianus TaxID=673940 RepID=A0ACB6QS03_9PLEO|nr:uncharacterized protein BDR25DRAFT_357224 [Lindgomyces ingoldianus]KAF2468862.1 hypothetical protein BDR25DRAFT_357224 [Lindgomyces ingoldianus]
MVLNGDGEEHAKAGSSWPRNLSHSQPYAWPEIGGGPIYWGSVKVDAVKVRCGCRLDGGRASGKRFIQNKSLVAGKTTKSFAAQIRLAFDLVASEDEDLLLLLKEAAPGTDSRYVTFKGTEFDFKIVARANHRQMRKREYCALEMKNAQPAEAAHWGETGCSFSVTVLIVVSSVAGKIEIWQTATWEQTTERRKQSLSILARRILAPAHLKPAAVRASQQGEAVETAPKISATTATRPTRLFHYLQSPHHCQTEGSTYFFLHQTRRRSFPRSSTLARPARGMP